MNINLNSFTLYRFLLAIIYIYIIALVMAIFLSLLPEKSTLSTLYLSVVATPAATLYKLFSVRFLLSV